MRRSEKGEMSVSSFFQGKNERDTKSETVPVARTVERSTNEQASTIGAGMQITGNIVCAGSLQIFGRVQGDIHATKLTICQGASVEGKVTAQDAVIEGKFNGMVHGNTVKLSKTATVDGEIFSKSLSIEQDALFEGVSRKLDKPVDAPSAQASAKPVMNAEIVPINAAVN